MKMTWTNLTASQTLTWLYVGVMPTAVVGTPISPGNSHIEEAPDGSTGMGFFGTYTGFQVVLFPRTPNGEAFAFAQDGNPNGNPGKAELEAMMSSMVVPKATS